MRSSIMDFLETYFARKGSLLYALKHVADTAERADYLTPQRAVEICSSRPVRGHC